MKIDKNQLLFGIDNPEFCYCTMWVYTSHHSEMAVRIMSTPEDVPATKKFYWIFTGVIYHEGPSKWQGADFYIDSAGRDNLLRKVINPEVGNVEELIKNEFYRLFKFKDIASGLEVKILATGIMRLEKLSQS